jgi:hypothetical protein
MEMDPLRQQFFLVIIEGLHFSMLMDYGEKINDEDLSIDIYVQRTILTVFKIFSLLVRPYIYTLQYLIFSIQKQHLI